MKSASLDERVGKGSKEFPYKHKFIAGYGKKATRYQGEDLPSQSGLGKANIYHFRSFLSLPLNSFWLTTEVPHTASPSLWWGTAQCKYCPSVITKGRKMRNVWRKRFFCVAILKIFILWLDSSTFISFTVKPRNKISQNLKKSFLWFFDWLCEFSFLLSLQ